jgi:hypothetical protein
MVKSLGWIRVDEKVKNVKRGIIFTGMEHKEKADINPLLGCLSFCRGRTLMRIASPQLAPTHPPNTICTRLSSKAQWMGTGDTTKAGLTSGGFQEETKAKRAPQFCTELAALSLPTGQGDF